MDRMMMIDVYKTFEERERRRKPVPPSRAMRITFGKYVGRPLDQIPRGDLRWVAANVVGIEPVLADAIARAINSEAIPDDVYIPDHDGEPTAVNTALLEIE